MGTHMVSEGHADMPGAEQQAEAAAAVERETRMGRVVEQLRKRLEQQQAENEQLEDLLRQADASLNGSDLDTPVHGHCEHQGATGGARAKEHMWSADPGVILHLQYTTELGRGQPAQY